MTVGQYVTAQGLIIPTVEGMLTQLAIEQRELIDPLLNTAPDSPAGQMNGIFTGHLRMAWEALEIAYNSNNPDATEGFLLDALMAITGTVRGPATRSKFTGTRRLEVNLDAATTLPIGTTFHVLGDPDTAFETTEEITSVLEDDYLVSAQCTVTGPVPCNAGTLTVIATPVAGLNSVTNPFDAVLGKNIDNETEARLRRERELRASGSATVDAIRADILKITLDDESSPIQDCEILENVTDTIDANGLPGHSLECLVYDGVSLDCPNDLIAQTIWDSKPGGIQMVGSSSGTAIDSLGTNRVVAFTRPTLREVILEADLLLVNPLQLPSQYLNAVREAVITEFTRRVTMGDVIRCNHYEAAILAIAGIEDVTVRIGFQTVGLQAPGISLTLGVREIGYIQSSGITVL